MGLNMMNAVFASAAIRAGKITSEELVRACLDRIEEAEPTVKAWTYLDPEDAMRQARSLDLMQKEGRHIGPLHGIPVGIKDIFETADMPTENGTVLHKGRLPTQDATAVALLRQSGAVIMGKTVTTELAVYAPGKTTNPHDPKRTPGGSSSGSAAAVASFMVPVSIGSQTNGSVIRPASYCGVYGYKPSRGMISRHGVLKQSSVLDHVGVFARTVEDIALIALQMMGYDSRDPAMHPQSTPDLIRAAAEVVPIRPRLAFVKSPVWDNADADSKDAFSKLAAHLNHQVTPVELPPVFEHAVGWHRAIMEADLAKSFDAEYRNGKDRLSPVLCEMIERGQRVLAVEYNRALEGISVLNREIGDLFYGYDAILTPATTGEAPIGLDSTGSPIFCTLWTLCGVPALSLPLLQGKSGMPIGVQLVAPLGDDHRLLRTARWLVNQGTFPVQQKEERR